MGHPALRLRWGPILWAGFRQTLELREVVEVVAGHGFDDGPEGHGATFGMGYGALALGLGEFVEQEQVPGTGGFEEVERGIDVEVCVARGPFFLVPWLHDRMVFCQGLAQTEAEDGLAVGEMGYDLAGAPFGRGRVEFDLGVGHAFEQAVESCGSVYDHFEGIALAEEFCVRIQFHEDRMPPTQTEGQL